MCNFFSAISNGKGKVLFLSLRDIETIEKNGNPENYNDWNSHTTIAHYNGIKGEKEDLWNKWEYDCETKKLNIDGGYNSKDDSNAVKKVIENYLAENNAIYCQKIYNRNSGNRNSGYRNSGDMNFGYRNSGDMNSGNWNSGNGNSGDMNSGNWNSGDGNSGNWNSGNWNSGNGNSGNRNSGDGNSGDMNSGNWNSGNRNSGYFNTTEPKRWFFNKLTDRKQFVFPDYFFFNLIESVSVDNMTKQEKNKYPDYKITTGFLRVYGYKEAWKRSFEKANKEDVKKTLELPNFNYKIFEEITGISKKMLNKKLK